MEKRWMRDQWLHPSWGHVPWTFVLYYISLSLTIDGSLTTHLLGDANGEMHIIDRVLYRRQSNQMRRMKRYCKKNFVITGSGQEIPHDKLSVRDSGYWRGGDLFDFDRFSTSPTPFPEPHVAWFCSFALHWLLFTHLPCASTRSAIFTTLFQLHIWPLYPPQLISEM